MEGSSSPELELFFSMQSGLGEEIPRTDAKVMLPHQAIVGMYVCVEEVCIVCLLHHCVIPVALEGTVRSTEAQD